MKIYTEVIGNTTSSPEWNKKIEEAETDYIFLDQWTAQKSRFLGKGVSGTEYPIALARHTQIKDGDVIEYDENARKAVVLRLKLSPVLVIDMSRLNQMPPEKIISISVELGHAIGNQHWPAVVKGSTVYVPLTVDKKVMESVMDTHHIEGISYSFEEGLNVIPYLAPHEIRRLFGGAGHESHAHSHDHGHIIHFHEGHDHDHHHEDAPVHFHEPGADFPNC